MNFRKQFRLMAPDGDAGGSGSGGGAGGGAGGGNGGGGAGGGGGGGGGATPHGITWLPADIDAEHLGHVQNKGWKDPADAVRAHRAAEKLIGADRAGRLVEIPPKDDAPAMAKFFDRLGRPATPADYKLPVPQGQDATFATAVATKFHELGIPLETGQALAAWWNDQAAGLTKTQDAAALAAQQADDAALAKDWGAERPARTEIARRGFKEIAKRAGLDDAVSAAAIDSIEKAVGLRGTLKMMAIVGDMLGEHGAEGIHLPGSFGMTPEGAAAKRQELMADPGWRAKAMNKDSAEQRELQRLDKILWDAKQRAA